MAGPARYQEWFRAGTAPAVLRRLLASHRVEFIATRHGAFSPQVYRALIELGWVFVHLDNETFVMVPQAPANADLIRCEGYRHIWPADNRPVIPANAPQVLEEAERALRHCPEGATFAWAYKANALYRLGRPEEAAEATRKVPKQLMIY